MRTARTIFLLLAFALILTPAGEAAISHADAKMVWEKVARPTELTALPFSIKEEKSPNAWVTNGESVTVTTGLLEILDTNAELYAVFAHEAGHIKLNHHRSGASRTAGLSLAAAILGNILGDGLAGAAINVGANLVNSGWSREQEIAADDYSVELAHRMGEDPVGMYSAISKLAKINKTEPSGFNSHPPDDRRLLHIKNKILELEPNAKIPEI
ncbi:MAG: M48 family metalloprotease [Synergistaceae bacterium]|nr:M48 family metalloprotease [Synergistaceae bacterium]